MARTGRPKKLDENADELLKALNFIAVATKGELADYQQHVMFTDGWVIASDGMLSAGHPVSGAPMGVCCPHFAKLSQTLKKVGKTLAITVTPTGRLSIKGDTITSIIPCLPNNQFPEQEWDDMLAPCDDSLKVAFEAARLLVDEDESDDVLKASVLVEPWFVTATDRQLAIQIKHGNAAIPPGCLLPKVFVQAVAKSPYKIVGIGAELGRSVTLYFENGSWLRTLIYADAYPIDAINQIMNVENNFRDIPKTFFEAAATCAQFADKEGSPKVILGVEMIKTHDSLEVGTQVAVEGFDGADKIVKALHLKVVSTLAFKIDCHKNGTHIFFQGDNIRAVTTCVARGQG